MAKSERQKAAARLDVLCRKILLIRDSRDGKTFRCISCGKIETLDKSNVSHYCGRAHLITRWDLSNIWLSCIACNKWRSGNLIEYRKALIEKIGIKEVERLEAIYQRPAGFSVFDLQLMYEEYKKIYENLKRERGL
jgi:5-methylcytosine-specific restriction endonuclease McrA